MSTKIDYKENNSKALIKLKNKLCNDDNIALYIKIYLFVFFTITLVYCSINSQILIGEWDDYSLPVVSIIKQHNFSIDANDIEEAKKMFPEWEKMFDDCHLSGYFTKNGGEMTFYFPLYSAACVPIAVLLNFMKLPPLYCFQYTNILSLMIFLIVVLKCLKTNNKKKILIILALSINPIVFYLRWPSAEVFIASLIGIAIVCWYNKWYKRAAVFISLAGMLNPTILFIGIIMIIDYFINLSKTKNNDEKILFFFKQNLLKIIGYGSCYIIALIPFVYNFYNTGHINLITSIDGIANNIGLTFKYFMAYLFDLNFGFLPYFSILFIIALILIPFAICKKEWDYIKLMIAFLVTVFMYSIMRHINCGMSGIARYNAWTAPIMIIAVFIYFDIIVKKQKIKEIIIIFLISGIYITGVIDYQYSTKTNVDYYIEFTPIAEMVLDKIPQLYNPLPSTFNSRVSHVDGGYSYETPIVYSNKDGHVRKILASKKDKDEILDNYVVALGEEDWLEKQVQKLSNKESYISVPSKYIIMEKNTFNQ